MTVGKCGSNSVDRFSNQGNTILLRYALTVRFWCPDKEAVVAVSSRGGERENNWPIQD